MTYLLVRSFLRYNFFWYASREGIVGRTKLWLLYFESQQTPFLLRESAILMLMFLCNQLFLHLFFPIRGQKDCGLFDLLNLFIPFSAGRQ